jgi:hypothetical protein
MPTGAAMGIFDWLKTPKTNVDLLDEEWLERNGPVLWVQLQR